MKGRKDRRDKTSGEKKNRRKDRRDKIDFDELVLGKGRFKVEIS